jgi:hypothetical protein
MIPVDAEVIIEVLLHITDEFFSHLAKFPFQPPLLTCNLLPIRYSRQYPGIHYKTAQEDVLKV